jgi:hypothetical protein
MVTAAKLPSFGARHDPVLDSPTITLFGGLMKLLIPTLLAMCCCPGAEPTIAGPAPTNTPTTVQSPIKTNPYRVMAIRSNPEGEVDLVKLSGGIENPADEGTEFVIQRGDVYVVSVRVVKKQDGMVECRVIPESWNLQRNPIEIGDVALARKLDKGGGVPATPATDQVQVPILKSEGPFEQALCLDGSRRSPQEWVVNPYRADSEKNQQRDMRKRLTQSITLSLKEVPLRESLKNLSNVTAVNIVFMFDKSFYPGEKEPAVTLNLQDVPIYDYIGYLCEVTDLFFRVDDHAIVIFKGRHHYHYRK